MHCKFFSLWCEPKMIFSGDILYAFFFLFYLFIYFLTLPQNWAFFCDKWWWRKQTRKSLIKGKIFFSYRTCSCLYNSPWSWQVIKKQWSKASTVLGVVKLPGTHCCDQEKLNPTKSQGRKLLGPPWWLAGLKLQDDRAWLLLTQSSGCLTEVTSRLGRPERSQPC